jgi:AGCS family alanine or glycine:cation symporter
MFNEITIFVENILLYPLFGYIPFIILWLGAIGIFLTLRFKFINITMFRQAIRLVLKGKTSDKKDTISPFSALMASVSATVGLGSLAGTAVAISIAGPGTIFWMILFGMLGMAVKAAEVHIGHKYRKTGKDGKISGGGFYYLADGLRDIGMPKLGTFLAWSFGIFGFFALFGMAGFQMNQIVSIAINQNVDIITNISTGTFDSKTILGIVVDLVVVLLILYILIGGIKRVGNFASAIVPSMFIIYLISAIIVLFVNADKIIPSIVSIFTSAFDFSSGLAGFLLVAVIGTRRGLYACEAGQGTAPIASSNSSMKKSQEQAIVTLLDPFLVSLIMLLNGLVIISSGVLEGSNVSGILLTKLAFSSVTPIFGFIVVVCALMFAFTTVMTDAYYYEKFTSFLFPKLHINFVYISYGLAIFLFGIVNATSVLAFADVFVLLMTIPNILGLYLLSNSIAREFEEYKESVKKTLEK